MPSSTPSNENSDSNDDQHTLQMVSTSAGLTASNIDDEYDSDDDDNSSGEDLDYLRSLQDRFSLQSPEITPLAVVKPLSCIPRVTSNNDDDDLETLRSIQRRFAHDYETDELPLLLQGHLPKSVENLVDALNKNRSCQRFIRKKLIEVEAKIEENKQLKERVRCIMDFQLACRRKAQQAKDPRVRLVSSRRPPKAHRTAAILGPHENSSVAKYRMVMNKFPVAYSKQHWSNAEKEKLGKGLKQQYQEMLLLNTMNSFGSDDFDHTLISTSDLDVTPERIRSFFPFVNWDRLASMYLAGRSGAECESRWLNCDDPLINHSPWTILEEKKLLFTLQERGNTYNWIDIATALGTQRTPFQCLVRYQRSLNPHILRKDWTEEEDAVLRDAVECFGESNWQAVSSTLEGRRGTQCSNRWRKSLLPQRRKVGKWSVDEDKRLKATVILFGAKKWHEIARFVHGRTQVQCRERWVNALDPSLNLGPWTEEEDARLLAAVEEHEYRWSRIATCVPPRTDSQCLRRWRTLCPHEVPLRRRARQLKKIVLVSNFVDRETERPLIGLNDFSTSIVDPPDPDLSKKGNRRGTSTKRRRKNMSKSINQSESLDVNVKAPDMVNASPNLVPAACSDIADSGSIGRRRKRTADNNKDDLCLVPVSNVNADEIRSIKRRRKKSSGKSTARRKACKDNKPGKSISESTASVEENDRSRTVKDQSLLPLHQQNN